MRIVIFSDANTVTTARLIRATVQLTDVHPGTRVVGVVTTRPADFHFDLWLHLRKAARRVIVAAANPKLPSLRLFDLGLDLRRLGRRYGIPVLVPPSDDPNTPEFVRDLTATLRPDVALSYYCRHRFGADLRSAFQQCVNYHDGLLPSYRGVMATSFSIYAGEASSGLTFHHMSSALDGGPILFQDAVPIDEQSDLEGVAHQKSLRAAAALPRLLELIAKGDPGREQPAEGDYFSVHDWKAMTRLTQPIHATSKEIHRRIRAFGVAHLTIEGNEYPVTRLKPSQPGKPLSFRTADAQVLAPDRFMGLPGFLYRDRRKRTKHSVGA